MPRVVTLRGLDEIITVLREDGRTVIGPVERDGVIDHAELAGADDLPHGWAQTEDGGTHRLEPTGTDERFAWATPSTAWKRYLHPPRTLMVRAHRADDGGVRVTTADPEPAPMAFFGVRSCDLAALDVLDRVFLADGTTDPTYAARRHDLFVVAVACGTPSGTCFCASMDTGPAPRAGHDLAITELADRDTVEYLVEAITDAGRAVLRRLDGRNAAEADRARAEAVVAGAVDTMGRTLDPTRARHAGDDPEHPRWADVAARCLDCGNCTMVCPTCFCSAVEDTTDLAGTTAERWRVWDSCFTLDFTHLHGGSVRTTTESRYRQWLLHKLVTWHDQFDTSGCVGCGRCITWCPVGIDLTVEAAALTAEVSA